MTNGRKLGEAIFALAVLALVLLLSYITISNRAP
jgi:hypothetical protein